MGDFQVWRLGNEEIAKKEDINIQGPFSPTPFPASVPAQGSLQGMNGLQQVPGPCGIIPGHCGIQEALLIQHVQRFGLKQGGPAQPL
jgi:hypothetical protein